LAAAIIATMGHRAPYDWANSKFMNKLELVINSTYCESIRGSPHWAMFGREPNTRLTALTNWTGDAYYTSALGSAVVTSTDVNNIIAEHHERMQNVQHRVLLSTAVAQALTAEAWDQTHTHADFKPGQQVLLLRTAPNRLLPHFTGPYTVKRVAKDGNFVSLTHFLDPASNLASVHVSRLLPFDGSRASITELVDFQLEPGSYVIASVIEHRQHDDGTYEFHVKWHGTPVTSWLPASAVPKNVVVQSYCDAHKLVMPGPRAPARRVRVTGTTTSRPTAAAAQPRVAQVPSAALPAPVALQKMGSEPGGTLASHTAATVSRGRPSALRMHTRSARRSAIASSR
jgi:hypothetical protein